jgi:hypothetical protein
MRKRATLLFIAILAVSSLLMVESAFAQSITKPSIPQFTIKYVDYSYDVPPTYGVDQYTGKNIIIDEGYHVDNRTVEFTIKNQPFVSYIDASGNKTALYYNFRFKGPYGNAWSYYPDTSHSYGLYTGFFPDTSASNSDYTVITVRLNDLTQYPAGTPEIPTGVQMQFQVQAIMGYIVRSYTGMLAGDFYGFTGERSDWSDTQTLTLGESQTSTSSPATTPTPTPPNFGPTSSPSPEPALTQEQLEIIIGVAIAAAVIGAGLGLLIYLTKRK